MLKRTVIREPMQIYEYKAVRWLTLADGFSFEACLDGGRRVVLGTRAIDRGSILVVVVVVESVV